MDKTAIKNYAVAARKKLIDAVKLKAASLGITSDTPPCAEDMLRSKGIFLTREEASARLRLHGIISMAQYNRDGLAYIMENVAYTWFNRLIALRFMEINGYLPSNIRILSSEEPGRIEPDALRESDRLDYVKPNIVNELKADTGINATEKLYKYILISQCNALADIMPGMFQKLNDYTELLLPDALYRNGGIVHDLVHAIPEDNFKNGVQIIGWLYQFYISEKKDEVFAGLKKNIKINKDTIPAATQLFTPEWIVKYMVENSLGRLWLEKHPNDDLRKSWKYYVDEAEQEPEVAEELRIMRQQSPINRPEDIKLIDPCMGSGHILVYAFDVLYQIYQSQGYHEREIPNLILHHNIYGLDIDDRAGQLAYFALMMKARGYNRRFFRQERVPQPMVYTADGDEELSEFGSLVKVEEPGEEPQLPEDININNLGVELIYERDMYGWRYRRLLAQKYDVVVTNPPYMAPTPRQADWVKKHYPNSKSDLCVVFIERNLDLLAQHGYLSMITMHSWMFLSSFERFRNDLIASKDIVNMLHLGARAFEEIGGEVVQATTFTMCKSNVAKYVTTYKRLVDYIGQQAKKEAFCIDNNVHTSKKEDYEKIPGSPIAYWVSQRMLAAFESCAQLEQLASPRKGLATTDNERFLRLWHEVANYKMHIAAENKEHAIALKRKWFPINKGGSFRRWYGNKEHLVNWENDGLEMKQAIVERYRGGSYTKEIRSENRYFHNAITWNALTSADAGFRLSDYGALFDSAGSSMFPSDKNMFYLLGLLNTKIIGQILNILNPTLNFGAGTVANLPIVINDNRKEVVEQLVEELVKLSRDDWDSFETSWDFQVHPLVTHLHTIEEAYKQWEYSCNEQFARLKSNEESLNRIFIDIYNLQDELTPEVDDKDITIRKADLGRDIRSFISYAVGCMFGRYSLDEPGLVFAGGKFDISRYKSFVPVEDNIIPIGAQDYFDNDIGSRFIEFVRVVYGEETLDENLDFIADALYPSGSSTTGERIRHYFQKDFYKDHVKIYQKRPIYWLMDSGKKDGFKALFYLHRYDKYTVTRARTDYLHPLQRKYDAAIGQLEMLANFTENNHDKAVHRKEASLLQVKLEECQAYDPVVSHFAHQQIVLDLDDGVKVNYAKFQGVEVPLDDGRVGVMDLLGRI
ncbi:MAG: BREX-1 system adenine-specific DNA-methyltransferase PglX [Defluviitaleaceae bacterium]|nr:BREX-1 system adenine-specific DNA-methyltransferase PglX [Defluviitaleaceae bacterium]